MQHTIKTRLRLLSGIQSFMDVHLKLIPAKLNLDFSSVPDTLKISDGVPEPTGGNAQNSLYFSLRNKIEDQRRRLQNLSPIGDKDMDHRRAALIISADDMLRRLEHLRDDAWTEHLLSRFLQLSSSQDGPLVVQTGETAACICRRHLITA